MSTNRSAPIPAWYPNLCHWWADEEMARLSIPAQNLFMRLIALSHSLQTGGRLTMAQVLAVCHGFARPKQTIDALLDAGVLEVRRTYAGGEQEVDRRYAGGTQEVRRRCAGGAQEVRIRCADKWLKMSNTPKAIPADQKPALRPSSKQAEEPRVRVEKEREKEREEERTPSGSVRSSSARAVPRSAGGAARPAPVAGCWQGDTVDDDEPNDDLTRMSLAEKKAAARNAIREGQRKGPATGKDTVFSRYDPNRKIVPLTSGFRIDGGAE